MLIIVLRTVIVLILVDEEDEQQQHPDAKVHTDEEIATIVDAALLQYDENADGYVEYAEFVRAQRKAKGN